MAAGKETRSGKDQTNVLYLAPWVDIGGSDKATIDWFRFLDRDRFRPSLITTQPSLNRRLSEVVPYAEELWELPQLIAGEEFPRFILSFIHTRGIELVHLMNSNIAFELLPDIAALPQPPKVVVQLLGEERNRTGYVRYVTTRFGNLVDCFSVCTHSLSARLEDYDVPASKRRVIPTAVDAERDFNPDQVQPIGGLDPDTFHILFLARLVDQKDPLLMVEVAAELRRLGLQFQVHVVGDGELAGAVRRKIAAAGLDREVILHGEWIDFAPWYAACQALLLTSRWEGLPAVVYEAMAMGVPVVGPALPGMDELVTRDTGVLIAPRDQPGGYAEALYALAAGQELRRRLGERGRSVVRSEFSLQKMAADHAALYDELLVDNAQSAWEQLYDAAQPTGATTTAEPFHGRRPGATPLVSVIVPCFNHGRYLPACLESIANQTYPSIETVIVDDGSTDQETLAALAAVERDGGASVLRLPSNAGPSAARNAGIEHARGRYILPLDADDLLVRTAAAELVEQLNSADERIGFIYPNLQFFGNRNDYLEMPSYNLHALLVSNYCVVSSLIDREVFDRGFRYPEDVVFGHDDWDFVLSLAESEIYGEPARTKTLLCRRHGFSRNDLIEASGVTHEPVTARHPSLFARAQELKAEWNPAVTIIALEPGPGDPDGAPAAADIRQTCGDFELIVRTSVDREPTGSGRRLRRTPVPRATSRAQTLAHGLRVARGRYLLATYGSLAELLTDPTVIEKTLRILRANPALAAVALADSGSEQPSWRPLAADEVGRATLGAVCWVATGPMAPPAALSLAGCRPLEALLRWLGVHAAVAWRHLPRRDTRTAAVPADGPEAKLGAPPHRRTKDVGFRQAPAALPECPPGVPPRLESMTYWRPAQTHLLCRHRHHFSGRYTYTREPAAPAGYALDHVLGCVRQYPLAGTISLRVREGEQAFALGEPADPDNPMVLGFLEQDRLPLYEPILSGRHPDTGERLLIAGEEDPLAPCLQEATVLGFVPPYPIPPPRSAHAEVPYGLTGLVRSVDLMARRHRYGAGHVPPGLPAGELGALFAEPTGNCEPLWIDEQGRVFTASGALRNGRPSPNVALRWTADPLTWSGFGRTAPRLRATTRRALESARLLVTAPVVPNRPATPAGYLLCSDTSQTIPLYAAVHPVTGDQLLSSDPSEAESLGYEEVALLGHLIARAPVTGKLGPSRPQAPWAARFGLVALEPREADQTQLRMRRGSLAGLPAVELPAGFSIRPCAESDLAAWAEIANGPMGYWDEARTRWELWADPDLVEEGVQLLLDSRGEIVGSATAKRFPTEARSGYLHMVLVTPDLRGRGLGRAVSLAAMHRMVDAGLEAAVLDTDDWRVAAIRTYLKLGFQPDLVADGHDARWRRVFRII